MHSILNPAEPAVLVSSTALADTSTICAMCACFFFQMVFSEMFFFLGERAVLQWRLELWVEPTTESSSLPPTIGHERGIGQGLQLVSALCAVCE